MSIIIPCIHSWCFTILHLFKTAHNSSVEILASSISSITFETSLASQIPVNRERGSGDSCAIFVQRWNSIITICHVVMHEFVITAYLDLEVGECSESVPS